ncbi:uncharacterized protein LOC112603669, partial [Melanaphis sacchari]|uniref:uncharacterized protein LOC112603669 n=1 Tax=Melanaphis sacchari TaxID=742174 RepID=UPI000DC1304B
IVRSFCSNTTQHCCTKFKTSSEQDGARGKSILPPLKVDDNVLVSIPSVNRGRGYAANLLSVVIEEKDGKFRITTRERILSTCHMIGAEQFDCYEVLFPNDCRRSIK